MLSVPLLSFHLKAVMNVIISVSLVLGSLKLLYIHAHTLAVLTCEIGKNYL